MRPFIRLVTLTFMTILLLSCDPPGLIESLNSNIAFISVTPSTAQVGVSTAFDIVVSYKLGEGRSGGVVDIAFNNVRPDCYSIADQHIVSTSTGTLSFTGISAVPADWGTAGQFSVAAILDSDQGQAAHAIQLISLTTGTM